MNKFRITDSALNTVILIVGVLLVARDHSYSYHTISTLVQSCSLLPQNTTSMNWAPRFLIFLLLSIPFTSSAADYFWIGGSGDWSDISHWATTSGGAITHSQAPTADDDVYFDGNSFTAPGQTVSMNTDIIFCRSMNWVAATNNPTFIGGANVTLNV
ncbi:MAG: hypothetical protein AAFY48_21520, partial [Bacteroidota bacterium]